MRPASPPPVLNLAVPVEPRATEPLDMLLAHRAGGHVTVSSAGTQPAAEVEPVVAQALTEAGVDLADAFSEPLTDEGVRAVDLVITMGCGDACPIVPGRRYPDWPVTGPDGAPVAVVRGIRDEIDARTTELPCRKPDPVPRSRTAA